ncbi:MAG: ferritin-like domain-containing protein [Opitutus sp.]
MTTPIALDEEIRRPVTLLLDHVLADEFALSTATRDYHWTVTGPHFRSLYELFDEQYRELDQWMGKIVDRARSSGLTIRTGWQALTESPDFVPVGGATLTPRSMISALIALHEDMAERLCPRPDSVPALGLLPALSGLLEELREYHETTAWLLSELLQDRELAQA